jgi:hypothetical protein
MARSAWARGLFTLYFSVSSVAWAATPIPNTDPLAAIDLNRNAIIADIVSGFGAQAGDDAAGSATLKARLEKLRADKLLAASLASSRESLDAIITEADAPRSAAFSHVNAKALGDPARDLVYTPLTPCRLIDTRGNGAPFQGGAFAAGERRAYVPAGACAIPATGVATMLVSFTTQNLTPVSGGVLAILPPAAPFTATVDVFNLGSTWSASNTAVATGGAGQFDVFVLIANAHVIVDVLGYFAPPPNGSVGTAQIADGSVTAAKMAANGCTNGQILKFNGAAWACAADAAGSGTVTGVTASAPIASSGGTAPNISLSGTVGVANGGTGRTTLATNGIVYGLGTSAVGTAVGTVGQVLAGTIGAPVWTASPQINGNLEMLNTAAGSGNGSIFKGGVPFIHDNNGGTFVGSGAGNFVSSGLDNTGIGSVALSELTSGANNTAVGSFALPLNSTGSQNTATGNYALRSHTLGSRNTANGYAASYFSATGDGNTAMGYRALFSNVGGSFNTAIGHGALQFATGSGNIALGEGAGVDLTTGNFNILLSHFGIAGESATIRIGNGNQTRAFIAGIRGVTTGVANGVAVLIDGNGQLGTVSSSRRFKDDIADMDATSSALMKLRPVTFHYKTDHNPTGRTLQYGLIAEEVAEVYPGLVARSADGQIETVMYQYLPSMLLNEYQKQQRRIEAQAKHIEKMERTHSAEIAGLKAAVAEVAELKQQMAHMARLLDQQRIGTVTAGLLK